MTASWHRLFISATSDPAAQTERIVTTLRALLSEQGYEAYDPFPGGTGTPPGLNRLIRVFVAPPQDGSICVIGEIPEHWLSEFTQRLNTAVLSAWLTEDDGGFAVYRDGLRHTSVTALSAYLSGGESIETLHQALSGALDVEPVASDEPPVAMIAADALPPELQALALDQGVDPDKAGSIFERLSGSLFGKLGQGAGSGADQAQARAVFAGGQQDIWNSLHGQRVRAVADVLNLPGNWRLPTFDTVREAYQVHRLRQRSPRMPLMPGDEEALRSVRDALSYLPVYMGRP